jgi:hypothetical protein
MAWIRSHDELYRRPEEVGVVAADTAISSMASVFVAVLMLALYLLTGLLTIAHSLHYVDPVALRTQVRRLRRRRTRRLARLRHQAALADNLARQHAEDFKLEQEYFAAQNERHDAWTHLLAELARVRFAVHLGDPSATDGLFPPPGAPTTPLLVPDDGATPNGATPNGATPNGATPNGATPNGAPLTEVPPSASRPSPAALPLDPDRPTRTGLPT